MTTYEIPVREIILFKESHETEYTRWDNIDLIDKYPRIGRFTHSKHFLYDDSDIFYFVSAYLTIRDDCWKHREGCI